MLYFFFFFSSRRRHTRWNCDWSSDVCSSDLLAVERPPASEWLVEARQQVEQRGLAGTVRADQRSDRAPLDLEVVDRSEERRVGKECRSRWSRCQEKKKSVER